MAKEQSTKKRASVATISRLLLGVLVAILVGTLWMQSRQIADVRLAIDQLALNLETSSQTAVAPEIAEVEPLPIRRADEIAMVLEPASKSKKVEEFARAVSEIDSWIFATSDEEMAAEAIDQYLTQLRERILKEVETLDKKALAAPRGKEAMDFLSQGAALLDMVPMPRDEAGMEAIRSVLSRREQVNARARELQRLRYNQWAIGRLEKAFKDYHDRLAKVQKWSDDDKLVEAASALSEIDPDLLSASSIEVYLNFYRLVNDAISEEHRITLAFKLNDPKVDKKSLADF